MAPKFGTSGLRGLVVDFTQDLTHTYTRAFISACDCNGVLYVGRDLRPSSPDIANDVIKAATAEGLEVIDCGAIPTPALCLASMQAGAGAVMVTGSHIPADRNGLKFYTPQGEITKSDETAIQAAIGGSSAGKSGAVTSAATALDAFVARYLSAFGPTALAGLRLGVYQHSAVGRDLLVDVLEGLGAEAFALERSDIFIPVDTEAVGGEMRNKLKAWCSEHGLDAVLSTDGDSDRPMLTNEDGAVIPGDILGVLTAQFLGAKVICTPISSNSMVAQMDDFDRVDVTRIGSPYVIDAMERRLAEDPLVRVAGYEANGGFLLGFTAKTLHGELSPLMTRDSILPMIAPLVQAHEKGARLSALVAGLPPVHTAAGRVQDTPHAVATPLIERLAQSTEDRAKFFVGVGAEAKVDLTDGLRVTFQSGETVHLRLSGNAPETRCYVEAADEVRAAELLDAHIARLAATLAG